MTCHLFAVKYLGLQDLPRIRNTQEDDDQLNESGAIPWQEIFYSNCAHVARVVR